MYRTKDLTRNALTTTDVYLIPTDMKKLGICIITDCELAVYEDVNMIKPYTRTPAEEKLYEELMAWIEADKEDYKKIKAVSEADIVFYLKFENLLSINTHSTT